MNYSHHGGLTPVVPAVKIDLVGSERAAKATAGWVVSSYGGRNQEVLKAMGLGRWQAGARDAAAGKLHGTPAGRRVGPETGSWGVGHIDSRLCWL